MPLPPMPAIFFQLQSNLYRNIYTAYLSQVISEQFLSWF